MMGVKINICSLNDPTSQKTWSGTPFNIYNELKKTNAVGSAFSSKYLISCNKFIRKTITILEKIYYPNTKDRWVGLIQRYLNSNKVKSETAKSESKITLHFGTMDLPFYKRPKDQKHYLFIDSTWNLWATNALDLKGYSRKLFDDAEKLERKSYSQVEHIFSISEYVKENLINHYGVNPEKISVVGTGLGVVKPFFGNKNYKNNKILFVAKGRFEDKGGTLVLEAFKLAIEKNSNLELTILGQNQYKDKIKGANINVLGFLPLKELQDLFNESSLFVMPALYEQWGLVYLEALACKIPIVGLNRTSFPELSGNSKFGFALDGENPNLLANIIIEAFSNPDKLEKMGKEGQEFCLSKFSWNSVTQNILENIERSNFKK